VNSAATVLDVNAAVAFWRKIIMKACPCLILAAFLANSQLRGGFLQFVVSLILLIARTVFNGSHSS